MASPKPTPHQLAQRKWATWRINPLLWVQDMFGDAIYKAQERAGRIRDGVFVYTGKPATKSGLSYQQEDACRQWGELLEAKLRLAAGLKLTERQTELSTKIGISIMSSNGNGKDFWIGLMTWHFMMMFKDARGLATANSGQQLKSVYWSEVANIRNLALKPDPSDPSSLNTLQQEFVMQSDRLYFKTANKEEHGKRHFLELVTINAKATPEEQGETLSGRHADHMVFFIDEWSGINDAVFKPLDRTLTGKLNLVVGIFNPTRNSGYAIDTHGKYKDSWLCLHWNAIYSDNVTREQIERLRKYGEDSPAYRIGVLGLPPMSSEDSLIPFSWIQDAVDRDIVPTPFDPVILGCDVGGGGDRSTICIRQGGKIEPILRNNEKDTMKTVAWIGEHFHANEASVAVIDSNGLGAGVADRLREMEFIIHPIEGQGKSEVNNDKYLNNRAHMYMTLREQFENKSISIPDDIELINELGAMKMELSGNKTKIGSKKDLRKALGFSPDLADSLAYSYAIPDQMYRKGGNHHKPLPRRNYGIV